MSGYSNRGEFAYWVDGRWLVNGWIDWQGNDNLAEFDHATEDIVHMAAEALLVELEAGGWPLRTPADRQRRMTVPRQHRPDGWAPPEGSWLWLTEAVLLDPPTGLIATRSYGATPG